jgi:hypothetical protein
MNKWYIALLGIIAFFTASASMLDNLNKDDDTVVKAWLKVEAAYLQRLALLGPYLQRAESQVSNSGELAALAQSFSAAMSSTPSNQSDLKEIAVFREKQEAVTAALAKLVVSQDIYPTLMKDPGFRTIHERLDRIESQISLATADYTRTLHEHDIKKQRLLYRLTNLMNHDIKPSQPDSQQNAKVAIVVNRGARASAASTQYHQLTVAAN